jgi:hypothetical protein
MGRRHDPGDAAEPTAMAREGHVPQSGRMLSHARAARPRLRRDARFVPNLSSAWTRSSCRRAVVVSFRRRWCPAGGAGLPPRRHDGSKARPRRRCGTNGDGSGGPRATIRPDAISRPSGAPPLETGCEVRSQPQFSLDPLLVPSCRRGFLPAAVVPSERVWDFHHEGTMGRRHDPGDAAEPTAMAREAAHEGTTPAESGRPPRAAQRAELAGATSALMSGSI